MLIDTKQEAISDDVAGAATSTMLKLLSDVEATLRGLSQMLQEIIVDTNWICFTFILQLLLFLSPYTFL